ncbi:MAG: SDR family NAD(P)-dependent oxidoreductase [Planctomycetota bacterium]
MKKLILLTGATDGIGLATAKNLASLDHHLLLHGRNSEKLSHVEQALKAIAPDSTIETYLADLSSTSEIDALANSVAATHRRLDVLINNAGVFKTAHPITPAGLDVRFAVNTIAPYLLTKRLFPLFDSTGRIINLSSAAQATVHPDAISGNRRLDAGQAYAQSKLALTMWSIQLGKKIGNTGPAIIAINPGSFLGSKMVKEAYGMEGKDIDIGADILTRAALSDEFADASGKYYDNDEARFATPHLDAVDEVKCKAVIAQLDSMLAGL